MTEISNTEQLPKISLEPRIFLLSKNRPDEKGIESISLPFSLLGPPPSAKE